MKAKNLTIILAACAFALASCKPKTETTEEQVKSGSTAVEEQLTPAPAVEAPAVEAPAVEAPAVEAPAVQEPAVQEPAVVAPATPAE
jgi:hypothetical protein